MTAFSRVLRRSSQPSPAPTPSPTPPATAPLFLFIHPDDVFPPPPSPAYVHCTLCAQAEGITSSALSTFTSSIFCHPSGEEERSQSPYSEDDTAADSDTDTDTKQAADTKPTLPPSHDDNDDNDDYDSGFEPITYPTSPPRCPSHSPSPPPRPSRLSYLWPSALRPRHQSRAPISPLELLAAGDDEGDLSEDAFQAPDLFAAANENDADTETEAEAEDVV
ncbi:MAG: hypothetical protein M1819_006883, partial [Sarea resinae]